MFQKRLCSVWTVYHNLSNCVNIQLVYSVYLAHAFRLSSSVFPWRKKCATSHCFTLLKISNKAKNVFESSMFLKHFLNENNITLVRATGCHWKGKLNACVMFSSVMGLSAINVSWRFVVLHKMFGKPLYRADSSIIVALLENVMPLFPPVLFFLV